MNPGALAAGARAANEGTAPQLSGAGAATATTTVHSLDTSGQKQLAEAGCKPVNGEPGVWSCGSPRALDLCKKLLADKKGRHAVSESDSADAAVAAVEDDEEFDGPMPGASCGAPSPVASSISTAPGLAREPAPHSRIAARCWVCSEERSAR